MTPGACNGLSPAALAAVPATTPAGHPFNGIGGATLHNLLWRNDVPAQGRFRRATPAAGIGHRDWLP